jgi:hypothetical protein
MTRLSKFICLWAACFFFLQPATAQLQWQPVDSFNNELPASIRIYKTASLLDSAPNIAYYARINLHDAALDIDTDTTFRRRLTPSAFFQRNRQPYIVVNGTFFSFQTNQNLNTVVQRGRLLAHNVRSVKGRGADSSKQVLVYRSALGIFKNGHADVAWVKPDSFAAVPVAAQVPITPYLEEGTGDAGKDRRHLKILRKNFKPWPVHTAIGGGPVLLQNGEPAISNNAEVMFGGKAINDKHPRTAMGYTADGHLIILVVQGRFKGLAEGASLIQLAHILQQLDCVEALNLDGGGSSCMLVNGHETIRPSDATGQRALPAVFLIKKRID